MDMYKEFNYKELGFNSEDEMKDSIKRAEKFLDMPIDERYRHEAKERMKRGNSDVDISNLKEEAAKSTRDKDMLWRVSRARERQKQLDKQAENQKFLDSIGQALKKENEKKAREQYEKERIKAEKELQENVYSQHNVKTDEQKDKDKALTNLIKNVMSK